MTMTQPLKPRLTPSTVAVIGASQRPQSLGTQVWDAVRQYPPARSLVAVNPKYDTLTGYTCLKDIKTLSGTIDAALISINAQQAKPVLATLATKRCQLAILIAEATDQWRQADVKESLAALKATADCRLLGPGSFGLMIPGQRVNLSLWPTLPKPGNIALIAQTGPIASMVLDDLRDTEVGFSSVITTGAEEDISAAELIELYAEDKNTRVIAVEFARVKNPRALFSALNYASRHKRVVVLASHLPETSKSLIDAVLRKTGVWVAESIEEFVAAVTALANNKLPRGNRLALVYAGGYLGARSTQTALQYGARLARPGVETMRQLQSAGLSNSLDNPIVLKGELEQSLRALPLLLQDDEVDAVMLLVAPTGSEKMPLALSHLFKYITGSQKPVLSVWFSDRMTRWVRSEMVEHLNAPLSVFQSIRVAARVFSALVAKTAQTLDRHGLPKDRPERLDRERIAALRNLIAESIRLHHFTLSPEHTDALAYLLGILTPTRVHAKAAAELPTLGATLGWPLWVQFGAKGLESLLPGKVIFTPSEALLAWEQAKTQLMAQSLGMPKVSAQVLRYQTGLAEPLTIRLHRDPIVGPVLTCERGSQQTVHLPLPASYHSAYSALDSADLAISSDDAKGRLALILARLSDAVASIPALDSLTLALVEGEETWLLRDGVVRLANTALFADLAYSHLLLPPPPLEVWETLTTPRGPVVLRPLLDGDFAATATFVTRLSDKSLYLRFHTRSAMTSDRLAQFYEHDPIRESIWVIADDVDIHAVANWHKNINSTEAEFGIVVEDAWQRMGFAKILMGQLIATAKAAGVSKLVGYVLKGNEGMRATMLKLGFSKEASQSNDTDTWSLDLSRLDSGD